MLVDRKKSKYRGSRVCVVCGTTADVGPHHIIPRSEGGLPLRDNIVYLCETHHNQVEGPFKGARERIRIAREEWLDQRRSKKREAKTHLDFREEDTLGKFASRLDELSDLRVRQGYLEPGDAKEYHFLLAKAGKMNPLDVVCLWCYPELHSQSLAERGQKTVSSALAIISEKAQNIINSHLKSLKSNTCR